MEANRDGEYVDKFGSNCMLSDAKDTIFNRTLTQSDINEENTDEKQTRWKLKLPQLQAQ